MTPKQSRFVEEYLVDLNATQAAIRAGYSAKTAEQQGYQLLQKTSVAEAIDKARAKTAEKLEISRERLLREYALMGFANMLDYVTPQEDGSAIVDLSKLTRDQAAAISEVTVESYTERDGENTVPVKKIKFKLADKKGNLDSIARVMGWNDDKMKLDPSEGLLELLGLAGIPRALTNGAGTDPARPH